MLIPPSASPLERLLQAGSVRPALGSPVDFRLIPRIKIGLETAEILRSADAIHLATAIRLQADNLIAYDQELLLAAKESGLTTSSPGA